jgi:sugar phosphate isomerase/epimerase
MNLTARLALNQATTAHWPLEAAVAGCADAGIAGIGLGREHVARVGGPERAARLVRDAGLRVSTLWPAGFFTVPGTREDNLRAVRDAATLGAEALTVISGGLPESSRDLAGARSRVFDGLAELVPLAQDLGVRLAIEPLHPRVCAEASVIVTLGQALRLAEQFPAETVGVVLDAWATWWDPDVTDVIARAGDRIFAVQLCDWLARQPANPKLGRCHVGDGVADVATLVRAVDQAGYQGLVEVEIFNEDVWRIPGEETLATMIERCESLAC